MDCMGLALSKDAVVMCCWSAAPFMQLRKDGTGRGQHKGGSGKALARVVQGLLSAARMYAGVYGLPMERCMVAAEAKAQQPPAACNLWAQLLPCKPLLSAAKRPSIDSDHLVAQQGVWGAEQGRCCCPDAWLVRTHW
jgi:hypothetical protein